MRRLRWLPPFVAKATATLVKRCHGAGVHPTATCQAVPHRDPKSDTHRDLNLWTS